MFLLARTYCTKLIDSSAEASAEVYKDSHSQRSLSLEYAMLQLS
jgi:hypothetical protein